MLQQFLIVFCCAFHCDLWFCGVRDGRVGSLPRILPHYSGMVRVKEVALPENDLDVKQEVVAILVG